MGDIMQKEKRDKRVKMGKTGERGKKREEEEAGKKGGRREKGGKEGEKGEREKEGKEEPLIGFIGQGFIGKNYADDFVRRGYKVVRYARGAEFAKNKIKIKECDIVFIAVPTPSTPKGFDYSIVESALPLVGKGKRAVIKSTILPGTTETLQKKFPDIFIFHSPEFLREASAAHDAAHPDRNIVGIPKDTDVYQQKAREILSVLPHASYEAVLPVREAELVKYAGNCLLYAKVVFGNLLYDVVQQFGGNWERIRDAVAADPRIGRSHLDPIHKSGHSERAGRGAGGHCFIKDFAAFSRLYRERVRDPLGQKILDALRDKNNALLCASGKDVDLLKGVYGRARSVRGSSQITSTKLQTISNTET